MNEEQELLMELARNLLEAARQEGDPRKARKLLDGAKRLKRWAEEGIPEHLR